MSLLTIAAVRGRSVKIIEAETVGDVGYCGFLTESYIDLAKRGDIGGKPSMYDECFRLCSVV